MLLLDTHRSRLVLRDGDAFNARQSWKERESLLFSLSTGDGLIGWGEAAPLPGFSHEGLTRVERDLANLSKARLVAALRLDTPRALLEALVPLCFDCSPSARFALETAALDLLGRRTERPLWQLLQQAESGGASEQATAAASNGPPSTSRDCRLVDLTADSATLASLAQAREPGAFKAKIGRAPAAEAELLADLRHTWGAASTIRLDANRVLPERDLDACLSKFAACQPEFVEEPSATLGRPRRLPVALAFDESLLDAQADPRVDERLRMWMDIGQVAALVIKPMFLGGFTAAMHWANLARGFGVAPVISHLFDGRIAHAACRHLSAAFGSRRFATGLAEHPALALWGDRFRTLDWSKPGLGVDPATALDGVAQQ
jgi:L-alanine-DL-glutamate epimerase-like enolase superfamily enzyme